MDSPASAFAERLPFVLSLHLSLAAEAAVLFALSVCAIGLPAPKF
jgi:hypothetical protein